MKKSLGKKFSPEFLNRIDEIVVFNELDKNEIEKIVKIEIKKFINRLSEIDIKYKLIQKQSHFLLKKDITKNTVQDQSKEPFRNILKMKLQNDSEKQDKKE